MWFDGASVGKSGELVKLVSFGSLYSSTRSRINFHLELFMHRVNIY